MSHPRGGRATDWPLTGLSLVGSTSAFSLALSASNSSYANAQFTGVPLHGEAFSKQSCTVCAGTQKGESEQTGKFAGAPPRRRASFPLAPNSVFTFQRLPAFRSLQASLPLSVTPFPQKHALIIWLVAQRFRWRVAPQPSRT